MQNLHKRVLLLGTALIALSPCGPVAHAQELEEIVVQARKRDETSQSVPLALSAFSDDFLEQRGLDTLDDVADFTAGFSFGAGPGNRNDVTIRGIGSNRFDGRAEPSVGIFIDEVYVPRFSAQLMDILDLQRIEVLKGPQGTLYGRNTIGGAIGIYTKAPSDEVEAELTATAGNKDRYSISGSVSGPLLEGKILGRISVAYGDREGFSKDTVSGRDDGRETFGVRGKLMFLPSDNLNIVLSSTYAKSDQNAFLYSPDGFPRFQQSPLVANPPQSADRYSDSYSEPGFNNRWTWLNTLRGTWDIGPVKLVSISSYQEIYSEFLQDLDESILQVSTAEGTEKTKAYSQEFRLTSTPDGFATFDGRMDWILGVYYLRDEVEDLQRFWFGSDSQVFSAFGGFAPVVFEVPSAGSFANKDSFAVFAETNVDLTKRLSLTAGARYSRDKLKFIFNGNNFFDAPGGPLPGPFSYQTGNAVVFESFDPKLTLSYKWADDIMTYATWSTGYKSGGLQNVTFFESLAEQAFGPEDVTAYEIGIKSKFLDRRVQLNVAGYHNKFKNLQVQRVISVGGIAQTFSENAGESTINGVEVELVALPVDQLTINYTYSYLDAVFDRFDAGINIETGETVDLSGNALPRAPKHSFSLGAAYVIPVSDVGDLTISGDIFWSDKFFFFPENDALRSQKSYALTDFRVSFNGSSGKYQVSAWVNNIFDVDHRTYSNNTLGDEANFLGGAFIWGERRSFGATLTLRL